MSLIFIRPLVFSAGNLSPAMGARNQGGIGLSYRPASLCSLSTQFQTRFLESIPRPIAGLKIPTLYSDLRRTPATHPAPQSCKGVRGRGSSWHWAETRQQMDAGSGVLVLAAVPSSHNVGQIKSSPSKKNLVSSMFIERVCFTQNCIFVQMPLCERGHRKWLKISMGFDNTVLS